GLWSQLDLMPTGEDLDDPAAFAHRRAAEDSEEFGDLDAELAKILGTGDAPQDDAGEQTGDGEERPNGEPDEGLGGDQDSPGRPARNSANTCPASSNFTSGADWPTHSDCNSPRFRRPASARNCPVSQF